MSECTDPLDATFEDASLQLNDGLTSCRSVVNDYRALILGVARGFTEFRRIPAPGRLREKTRQGTDKATAE